MAPFKALYERKCRTPLSWFDEGDKLVLGPDVVQDMSEKVKGIREKLKIAQDRQKAYYDRRRKPLEFEEGDHVFLRANQIIGIGRSIKSKKITPKYLGPYQILRKVGTSAYQVALPPSLSNLHDVFHVSQTKKYIPYPSQVIRPEHIQLKENLTYTAEPKKILDRRMKQLRKKEISLVKVAWSEGENEEATWELEEDMRRTNPQLFSILGCEFRGRNSQKGGESVTSHQPGIQEQDTSVSSDTLDGVLILPADPR
ncbi:uncharacterized protein LOC130736427 [Lotus japonicus]|uniref:uncharacterized protein LOC130736427 n=1 Tax=Lotus japonicus TaxID=34305 RepID=UPI0025839855|nr:uncharacterized protein LOC130736427 [Lotus japonicus]